VEAALDLVALVDRDHHPDEVLGPLHLLTGARPLDELSTQPTVALVPARVEDAVVILDQYVSG
jgi:hypothetical protein